MEYVYNFASMLLQAVGVISVITGIVKLLLKFVFYINKQRYIKTLFMFETKQCYISQSIYKREATNGIHDFVTVNSMICFQKLQYMLNEVGYKVIPYTDSYMGKNIIHIGGPGANINVNSIFATKKVNFKTVLPSTEMELLNKQKLNTSCFKFKDDGVSGFEIGKRFLEFNEEKDYGIFIRIPNCKETGIDYTTHIIFAEWSSGTVNAVDFFTRNYKMIANIYKKERYCFAVPISRINNSTELLQVGDIIDLTNDFFGKE